jgi:fumarate hydratase class I
MPEFMYQEPFPLGPDSTHFRLLTSDYLSIMQFGDHEVLKVDPEALTVLAREAFRVVAFYYRESHLTKVAAILDDSESSPNDRRVALALLKNAVVAAGGRLPMCQDTGTAIVFAKKGQRVWTDVRDEEWLARGIFETYQRENLRYSQTVPLSMYEEVNSRNNLPAQVDISASEGEKYEFLFVAKGGGSANKSLLFQESPALLEPANLEAFLDRKLRSLGTAACPPYHLAVIIGGTSAEATMKTVKLACTGYLDNLPTTGNAFGQAFRDPPLEQKVMELARRSGIGAQFGGKYFALDARVIRIPRHGASCPVGIGVSCAADRNLKARIDRHGLWIEELERNPARFIPEQSPPGPVVEHELSVDLNRPIREILAELSCYPVATPLRLSGSVIVARDAAHARIKQRLDRGEPMPQYLRDHPVYYAGPAKTPNGLPSGSFGPTTAGRMDGYVDLFQSQGGSLIMIAKGNRSRAVTDSCKKHGGFYLGSIGGPAALLASENIKKVELLEYPELGMEAVYKIEVVDFPAFILIDDKGNDFFARLPVIS